MELQCLRKNITGQIKVKQGGFDSAQKIALIPAEILIFVKRILGNQDRNPQSIGFCVVFFDSDVCHDGAPF
jgi:hypothetical protein